MYVTYLLGLQVAVMSISGHMVHKVSPRKIKVERYDTHKYAIRTFFLYAWIIMHKLIFRDNTG